MENTMNNSEPKLLDLTKPIQTRNGVKVSWIVDSGADITYPITYYIEGEGSLYTTTRTGIFQTGQKKQSGLDLLNVEPAIAAGRNPEKLTTEQIKGYRCLSEEEFEALEYNSSQLDIYYSSDGEINCCGDVHFYKGKATTYFTDKPEGYFLPKQEPEKPYWSKPEDVPLDVDWMRHKERKIRVRISAVYTHAITCFGIGEIRFEEIKDYETWDGSEWQECRCK